MALLAGADVSAFSVEPASIHARLRASLRGTPQPFILCSRDGRRFSCEASPLDPDTLLLRLSGGPDPELRATSLFEARARLQVIESPGPGTLRDAARRLLEEAIASLGASWASLHWIDASGANLELLAHVSAPEGYLNRVRLLPLTAVLPVTDALKQARAVYLETATEYEARYPRIAAHYPPIMSFAKACMPLELEGRRMGCLALAFPSPRRFEAAERAGLDALAVRCAQALDHARLSDAERAARAVAEQVLARLERLHAFTGALALAINPSEVVEVVVDMGLSAAEASAGGFWQVSEDGKGVRMLRGVGSGVPRAEQLGDLPLDVPGRMPILDAIRSGTPIWIESCQEMEERYPAFFAQTIKPQPDVSLACLPVLAQGRCIAGLTYRFDGAHWFTEDERAFLQLLSWYAAQAFERARLYAAEKIAREAAVASQRRAEFLANAGNILMSSLDYHSTLASLAQAAVPTVADWCVVQLTGTRSTLPVIAHEDPSKIVSVLLLREYFRTDGVPFGIDAVLTSGESRCHREITRSMLKEVVADRRFLELCDEVGAASSMIVPILARGRVLGAILLASTSPTRLYEDEDLAMAEELARRAGIAVDNALLYSEARDADRRKDEFLAMLGHELRNPLAPIRTALDLMNLKEDAAFEDERLLIARQVDHLVGLVDDLLDVSRITSGKIELRKVHVDVAEIVASAIEMASPALERRAHQLASVLGSHLTVLADPARVSQAITNLLTNAAKFTEPGGRIDISAAREDDAIVIRVKDSGIGITKDVLQRIFDPFFQSARARERSQGGLGLGLTIVASLVELHGGTVMARSDGIGSGSEFVIRLPPAAEPTADEFRAASSRAEPSAAQSLRVLVVDDNKDAASMLVHVLRRLGCTVHFANDGPSALALLPDIEPELALLDIRMPGMDGYELASRLRTFDACRGAYFVAVTGYGQESDRQRAFAAGFDEHIVKPVDLSKLRELIARCNRR